MKNSNKQFILILVFCFVLQRQCLSKETFTAIAEEANHQPNVILVMADDQGWGDMAYNGHQVLKTPNFDAMAKAGLRMDRFYAAAPVCSPTRASVLTGRHPNRMGVFKWGYPIRPQEKTLAEKLKAAGYATAHFGKWHLGSVRNGSPAHPGNNGFDHWISAPNFYENNPILSAQGRAVQYEGESSLLTAKLALDWIKVQTENDKPFFAVVWFGSPHGPHVGDQEFLDMYPTETKNKRNFYAEISGMDRALGDIRAALKKLKIADNTVLWYTSDNGALPNVGSTGGFRGHKGQVYEGGLLVPSIVEWPAKIKKPMATSIRGNTCDIFPTVLEIAGIAEKPKHQLDGISLVPLIEGKMSARDRAMGFWDYQIKGQSVPSARLMKKLLDAQDAGGDLKPNQISLDAAKIPDENLPTKKFVGHSAWIDGDWKLHRIEMQNGQITYELYDLKNDPYESRDQSTKQAEMVRSLSSDLRKWLVSVANSYNGDDYIKR
jgi:arylsulfatase A-like enzyme